jgi:putative ABC transport system permease protein
MNALSDLTMALRLARRELRGGFRGFRVFALCLFLGVAAIAAIGSLSQALLTGLAEDGRTLLGGDIDLRLTHREATAEQMAWLAEQGVVSHVAEMRAMLQASDEPLLVEMKAVDDLYPLYGEIGMEPPLPLEDALARREGAWGLAVDQVILDRLDLRVGDETRIGEARFRITAHLSREPDRLARGLSFGPPVLASLAALEASGLLQPGSLIRHHYRLRLSDGADIGRTRAAIVERFPDAGWRITDARRASPRVYRFLSRVELYLTLVGLSSLLLGGLGVANATRAYLATKTETVATLKCLGASRRLVFLLYLFLVMALALPAVLMGLAVGAAAPFIADGLLGEVLGWRGAPGPFTTPLALAAVFGILTALTFALMPLARAAKVSPSGLFRAQIAPGDQRPGRVALAALSLAIAGLAGLAIISANDWVIAAAFVACAGFAFALFHLLARSIAALAARGARLRQPLWRLALANLHRPGAATGAMLLSLGLGLTLLSAIVLVEANLDRQVGQVLPAQAPSFYFLDIQPDQVAAFERIVEDRPGAEKLRKVPILRGRITAVDSRPPEDWEIPDNIRWVFRGDRGLTWRREPLEGAVLTAGEWWPADYDGPPLVSLDAAVGEGLGIGPGDSLTINVLGRDFVVRIANLRRIDWSALTMNFVLVFSPGFLESAPQTYLATVEVPKDEEGALERAVFKALPNVAAVRVRDALAQVTLLMGRIGLAVKSIAAVALLAGILVLIGAVAADQDRRTYDAVVLKVLGATRRRLLLSYFLEHGLIALVGAAIAGILGAGAAYLVMTQVMRSEFVLLAGPLLTTLGVSGALALVFGVATTFRALGRRPAALLRNH